MAITSETREIYQGIEQCEEFVTDSERQKENYSIEPLRNGYLKQSSLPVMAGELPELANYFEIQDDFYTSLSNLETLYQLKSRDYRELVFPVNMAKSFRWASIQLKKVDPNAKLIIAQGDNHQATLSVVTDFNTNYTLYYIPVEPLYDLLQNANRSQTANLLLSIFAYLYQIVGISHYSENYSYLTYAYESLANEYFDDDELDHDVASLNATYIKEIQV